MTLQGRVLVAAVVLFAGFGGAALAITIAELLSMQAEPLE